MTGILELPVELFIWTTVCAQLQHADIHRDKRHLQDQERTSDPFAGVQQVMCCTILGKAISRLENVPAQLATINYVFLFLAGQHSSGKMTSHDKIAPRE